MRGTNFSALVSSIETVNRSPKLWEGPLKPTMPAPRAATSTRARAVSTERATRQITFLGVIPVGFDALSGAVCPLCALPLFPLDPVDG